jgi:transcriptional regulator with XRE-family HTH domain
MKKIDYHLLVRELLEGLFLSQQELAVRCRISQQSVSNWKTRTRNPGIFARKKILELAQKEGIDISKYETDPARDVITRYLEQNKGRELVRIFELYQKMSRRDRVKLIRYANSLAR